MKLHRTPGANPQFLTFIPILNVLFLVVAFFFLSNLFVIQSGVAISPPFSPFGLSPMQNPRIISITGGPAPEIFYRDQRLSIDELVTLLDQDEAHGPSGAPSSTSNSNSRSIIIRADRGTPYELVMQVSAQCLSRGLSVALATSPSPK